MKVQHVISDLKAMRSNDQLLHDWYEQAEALANDIGVRQKFLELLVVSKAEKMWSMILLKHIIEE